MPSIPKAQTAKEVIAANVKLLIEQLEAGHSEGLTNARFASTANAFLTSPSRKVSSLSSRSIAPALGMSYGSKIAILPGQEPAEDDVATLVEKSGKSAAHVYARRFSLCS